MERCHFGQSDKRVPGREGSDTGHEETRAGLDCLHVFLRWLQQWRNAGNGGYAASKAGLIGLMQSLASDHAGDGVRVNALLPGGTITPSGGEGDPAALDFIANLHPMKRMANAKEVAQAALFLLSDRSTFMTGSPMIVDGGMSVRLT